MTTTKSEIVSHYPNGQLRIKTELVNGMPHGVFHEYFEDGRLRRQYGYFRGWHHGICRQWLPSGVLAGEFEMKYGTGRLLEWYDDGCVKLDWEMVAGEQHGVATFYDIDGGATTEHYWHGRKVSRKRFEGYKTDEHRADRK
jgi:antitoxin component YwqK of YwqJK toxin-antitoxin module